MSSWNNTPQAAPEIPEFEIFNTGKLPDEKLELDYRSSPHTEAENEGWARKLVAFTGLGVFLLVVLLRLSTTALGPLNTIIVAMTVSLVVALLLVIGFRISGGAALGVFLAGPLLGALNAVMLMLTEQLWAFAVMQVLAVVLAVQLVDGLRYHAAMWFLANPRVPRPVRQLRQVWYRRRWNVFSLWRLRRNLERMVKRREPRTMNYAPSLLQLRREELRLLSAGSAEMLLVLLAYALLSHLPHTLGRATLTLVLPPVLALLLVRRHCRGPFRLRSTIVTLWAAFVNWAGYQRRPTPSPGVFESPVGTCLWRLGVTVLAALAVGAVILPQVHYFPVVREVAPGVFGAGAGGMSWEKVLGAPGSAAWYLLAGAGLTTNLWHLWAIVVGLVACLALPFLALGSLALVGAGPFLERASVALEADDAPEQIPGITLWEAYVRRLRESENRRECRQIFCGATLWSDSPVLTPPEMYREHVYIAGRTGGGKTAVAIAPTLLQLIELDEAAVCVIDLKGDMALFNAVKQATEAKGRKFKFYSNQVGRPTYAFNFMAQGKKEYVSVNQFCETFLEALNLSHGEGYGRSFFTRKARQWLTGTLKVYPDVESFAELYELAAKNKRRLTREELSDIFELLSVIESLAGFESLNVTAGRHPESVVEAAIHFPDVIKEKQVVYFFLPATIEGSTVREIAKMAVYSLISSAIQLQREGERLQTFLAIDEFQRMASEGFKIVLEQARSLGIGAILANQTFADLKTHDTDLRPTVAQNTRIKITFSAIDREQQEEIMWRSGTRVLDPFWWVAGLSRRRVLGTTQRLARITSVTRPPTTEPRITQNQLTTVSDDPFASILEIVAGDAYAQFGGFSHPVTASGYTVTPERYEALMETPWPDPSPETLVTSRLPPEPEVIQAEQTEGTRLIDDDDEEESDDEEPPSPAAGPDPSGSPFPPPPGPRRRGRGASRRTNEKGASDGA